MKQNLIPLEEGDICFFYRPRVQTEHVHNLKGHTKTLSRVKRKEKPILPAHHCR